MNYMIIIDIQMNINNKKIVTRLDLNPQQIFLHILNNKLHKIREMNSNYSNNNNNSNNNLLKNKLNKNNNQSKYQDNKVEKALQQDNQLFNSNLRFNNQNNNLQILYVNIKRK